MPYLEDFSTFKLWTLRKPSAIAIGWLDGANSYSRGPVTDAFVQQLCDLLVNAWNAWISWGAHDCNLCTPPRVASPLMHNGHMVLLGKNELCVPCGAKLFVSPVSIIHYIKDHGYCPPQEYQDAVMQCPEMNSEAYFRALLKTPAGYYVRLMRAAAKVKE